MDNLVKGDYEYNPGIVNRPEKKFKSENFGYMEFSNQGDNNKEPGVVKKKESKFEPQTLGYQEFENKGDDRTRSY